MDYISYEKYVMCGPCQFHFHKVKLKFGIYISLCENFVISHL